MNNALFIVPYRNRASHLNIFSKKISSLGGKILVVEQSDGKPFNRGKLLNVGALWAFAKQLPIDYFIFHDVDMIPVKADYSMPKNPTHIATRCSQFRYKMPYPEYFGGVTLFTKEDFFLVDGYSSKFWSWGCEDDEMRRNVLNAGLKIDSRQCTFDSLHHRPEDRQLYRENLKYLQKGERDPDDGLFNCKFFLIETFENEMFTKIKVDI